ncbi:MAG: TerB family tellurite resistance protein [Pseudomonadota bacterium]
MATDNLFGDFANSWTELHLNALAAVFAMIACCDHDAHPAERARFIETAHNNPLLRNIPFEVLADKFASVSFEFLRDYEGAWKKYLSVIEDARRSGLSADEVINAAQIAIVSDNKVHPTEEAVLLKLVKDLSLQYKDV